MSTDTIFYISCDDTNTLSDLIDKCTKNAKELEQLLDRYETEVGDYRLFLKIHSRFRQLGNLVKKINMERTSRDLEKTYLHFCAKFKELLLKLQTVMNQRKQSWKANEKDVSDGLLNTPLNYCSTDAIVKRLLYGDESFKNVELSKKKDGNEIMKAISQALSSNTYITRFSFINSHINDKTTVYISDYIKNTHSLRELNLSQNKIGDAGIKMICDALLLNTTISVLILNGNPISNDGLVALGNSLKYNSTITSISLDDTNINEYGFRDFLNSLIHNFSLVRLSVKKLNIKHSADDILNTLKNNFSISEINFSPECIDSEFSSKISQILARNEKGTHSLRTDKGPLLINDTLFSGKLKSIDPSFDIYSTLISSQIGLDTIPPNIYKMEHLVCLDLRGNHLVKVSDSIGQLTSLQSLHLSYNDLLVIPFTLANLTNLKTLSLHHNPLTWIPENEINHEELLSKGPQDSSLFRFLREVQTDHAPIHLNQEKLFLLGDRKSGKTAIKYSIAGNLKSRTRKWSYLLPPYVPTYGIEISEIKVKSNEEVSEKTFQVWEFGGSEHQLYTFIPFILGVEKYVVVVNLYDFDSEEFQVPSDMMKTISALCGNKTLFLVGTHTDRLLTDEIGDINYKMKGIIEQNGINVFCSVSNKFANGIDILKRKLLESQGDELYEKSTVIMYQVMRSMRLSKPYLTVEEFTQICNHYGITEEKTILKTLDDLIKFGAILRFPGKRIRDYLFIDLNFISSIIHILILTASKSGIEGIVKKNECRLAWMETRQQFCEELVFEWCTDLGYLFDIDENNIIVPCYLPMNPPHLSKYFPSKRPLEYPTLNRAYEFEYLPLPIFGLLLINCLQIDGVEKLCWWRYGIVMEYKNLRCKITMDSDQTKILIQVLSTDKYVIPKELLTLVQNSILETLSIWCPKIKYQEYIPRISRGSNVDYIKIDHLQNLINQNLAKHDNEHNIIYEWISPDLYSPSFDKLEIKENISDIEHIVHNTFKGKLGEKDVLIKEYSEDNQHEFEYMLMTLPFLKHSHITEFLGVKKEARQIITESSPNGSLYDILPYEAECKLSLTYRIRIAIDIAICMEYIHSQSSQLVINGLDTSFIRIHSLIEDDIVAKLDFSTRRSSDFHKSIYAAPEIKAGKTPLQRSDVYSFGVILFQLWNGKKLNPYEDLPDSISYDRLNTPIRELDDLMSICLHRNEIKRPEFGQIAHQLANIYKMLGAKEIPKKIVKRSNKLSEWNRVSFIHLDNEPQIVAITGTNDNYIYCVCNNGMLYSFMNCIDGLTKLSEVRVNDKQIRINDLTVCGNNIWCVCDSNNVTVVKRDTYEVTTFEGHHGLCIASDKQFVYIGSADGSISMYDGKTMLKRKEYHETEKMPFTAITVDEHYIWAALTKVEPDKCCGYICVLNKKLELIHKWEAHSRMITGILSHGDIIWSGSFDMVINIWNISWEGNTIKTGVLKPMLQHKDRILKMCQHGERGYTLEKNLIISWNLSDRTIDSRIEISNCSTMYVHTDCILITGSKNGRITLWRKHYQ